MRAIGVQVLFAFSLACLPTAAPAQTTVPEKRATTGPSAGTTELLGATPPAAVTLFRNVRVFDGMSDRLSEPSFVLVRGNVIERVSSDPISVDPGSDALVIDGNGVRTLMPGLIDAHWHAMMASAPRAALQGDVGYLTLLAAREAEATLMRGFTSVRDMGGPTFALKRAIDEGVVIGPRIWPSGAMISQTGGHGDFREPHEVPAPRSAPPSRSEVLNGSMIADGPDEVLRRTREQLMIGASQIKLHAGGGVASPYDPLDVSQYTPAEFRAAVEAAENWGTYVTVHAYTPRAIRMAVEAGVRCVDHGHLLDEPTAKLMAERGVWLSLQPFLDDADANPYPPGSPNRAKQLEVSAGTDRAYALAKAHELKVAWGTDVLFDPSLAKRQARLLTKLTRWYTPAEVLRMATGTNAELLALSGPRSPYTGKLGVVNNGALADLLLVDGDPLADLALVADPQALVVIMKDGKVFKNALPGAGAAMTP